LEERGRSFSTVIASFFILIEISEESEDASGGEYDLKFLRATRVACDLEISILKCSQTSDGKDGTLRPFEVRTAFADRQRSVKHAFWTSSGIGVVAEGTETVGQREVNAGTAEAGK